jgi:Fungal Zn(2)-Cys(6) binuclear cluster domain
MALGLFPRSEPHAPRPSSKIRLACDHCHSQKLRCIRNSGQTSCHRCVKVGFSCRFSLRASRASSKASEPNAQENRHDSPFSMSLSMCMSMSDTHPNVIANSNGNNEWLLPPSLAMNVLEQPGLVSPVLFMADFLSPYPFPLFAPINAVEVTFATCSNFAPEPLLLYTGQYH